MKRGTYVNEKGTLIKSEKRHFSYLTRGHLLEIKKGTYENGKWTLS